MKRTCGGLGLLALVAAGCGGSLAVRPEQHGMAAPGHAIVLLRFGAHPKLEMQPTEQDLTLRRIDNGQSFDIPFREGTRAPGGFTTSVQVNLPAGQYRIQGWKLMFPDRSTLEQHVGAVTVRLQPDRVACMGALYAVTGHTDVVATQRRPTGHVVKARLIIVDECEDMIAEFKRKFPAISAPIEVFTSGAPKMP